MYVHGNITRKLPVWILLSQTSKDVILNFFLYKIREQEGGPGPAQGGVGTSGRVEMVGKRGRRVNTLLPKMCTKNVYTCI
jgi:hypothetical protein